MDDVSLTFLGPPEVRHAGQVLLFSTRKELALLIYLAVEGRVYLRKKLSEQFRPEGDERHGRANRRPSASAASSLPEDVQKRDTEIGLLHKPAIRVTKDQIMFFPGRTRSLSRLFLPNALLSQYSDEKR